MPPNGLTRRRLMTALAVLPGAAAARADTVASVPPDPQVISDLVAANHILVRKAIILIQAHISVRHDRNPNRYFLARDIAPETVATADIMEFDLDSNAVDPKKGNPYLERFIHGEIYKARPDVTSVVHAHTPSLLPFATSDIPLRPVYHRRPSWTLYRSSRTVITPRSLAMPPRARHSRKRSASGRRFCCTDMAKWSWARRFRRWWTAASSWI